MSIPQGGAVREDNHVVKVPVGPRQVGCNDLRAHKRLQRTHQPPEVCDADISNQRSSRRLPPGRCDGKDQNT